MLTAVVLGSLALPTLALSTSVQGSPFPRPVLEEATLLLSAPIGNGKIARMWLSPSTSGGECRFITADPDDTDARPARLGGGSCTPNGSHPPPPSATPLETGFSTLRPEGPILYGRVSPSLHASRVELRWRTGSMQRAFKGDTFLGGSPRLYRPPFDNLPYMVIANDLDGREVARRKFASRMFYLGSDKQAILTRLRDFARQHRDRRINP